MLDAEVHQYSGFEQNLHCCYDYTAIKELKWLSAFIEVFLQ